MASLKPGKKQLDFENAKMLPIFVKDNKEFNHSSIIKIKANT